MCNSILSYILPSYIQLSHQLYTDSLNRHVESSVRRSFQLIDIRLLLILEMSGDDAATCLAPEIFLGNKVLDTHDMAAVTEPVEKGVAEDIDEADKRDDV
jgi:hypothetical protein